MRWVTTILGIVLTVLSVYGILYSNNTKNVDEKIIENFKDAGEYISDLPQIISPSSNSLNFHLPTPLVFDGVSSSESVDDIHSEINIVNIIYYTNENRKQNNLPNLFENSKLNSSAQVKAADMLNGQYFEHSSPEGVSVGDLVDDASYKYIMVGENLAMGGFKTSKDVVDAWMASVGHRENILNSRYVDIGIGIVYGNYQGDNVWLLVQHFARPIELCPSIDQSLEEKINTDQETLSNLEKDIEAQNTKVEETNKWSSDYQGEVEAYNDLVSQYNALLEIVKENIDTYNATVQAFNACIAA